MILLAIDGGKRSPGLAWFEGKRLMKVGIYDQLPDAIVYELPVFYPNDPPGKVPALIILSVATGRLVERYARTATYIEAVEARTWKGNVPKSVTRARVLKRLTTREKTSLQSDLSTLSSRTHVDHYDAVGIGLWWLEKEGIRA